MNQITIIGNLVDEPRGQVLSSGTEVCNFRLADEHHSSKKGKEVYYWNVAVFGKQALACTNNLVKGQSVVVFGRMTNNTYEDKEGITRISTQIVASYVSFGPKPKSGVYAGRGDEDDEINF